MLDQWVNYTAVSGIHEFTSPTYTYVQVSALYAGYIYAQRPGARETIGRALDMMWSDTAANYFEPRAALGGAHSRDYDFLLGRGMLEEEMYAHAFPGFPAPGCSYKDPHCEGPSAGVTHGTGEPMTVLALSLHNLLHPCGYRLPAAVRALMQLPQREVQSRFLSQPATANGLEARFADTYNYVEWGVFAIGSMYQDYICNTHHKYYPNPRARPLCKLPPLLASL